jgi:hypothetical protein
MEHGLDKIRLAQVIRHQDKGIICKLFPVRDKPIEANDPFLKYAPAEKIDDVQFLWRRILVVMFHKTEQVLDGELVATTF